MNKADLHARIGELVAAAKDTETGEKRAELLRRYLGEPYQDMEGAGSQFVDAACQDAVEAILPEVMDVFTSAPDLVEFSPVGMEDQDAAQQETAAVSHIFWQKNQGFLTLYTWLKEAMIQQNAYVWRGWQEKKRIEVEEYEGLTFPEYLGLIAEFEGKEYEIEEQTGVAVQDDPETGQQIAIPEFDDEGQPVEISLRVRCTETTKEYMIEAFPQEDFFSTPQWSSLSLDGIPCAGRRHRNKTPDDWRAFGFSDDSVSLLQAANEDSQAIARNHTQDLDDTKTGDEVVELVEAYVRIDTGKGAPELLRVWCTADGGQIMEWASGGDAIDPVPSVPIVALTPFIMPHRHHGQSVVEKVDDLAKVKTVLTRQMLDNMYLTNYPRPVFNPDVEPADITTHLLNPAPGAPIPSRAGIAWSSPPPVAATALPMLEKFDGLQEVRTGATRYNQGLDAESLNKTASGISQIMGASQKKAKLIARTFAETGLRELFLGIHADLRRGPVKEMVLKLQGQWVPVNPRTWRHRSDMVVNVGMGRGDRDERRAALMMAGQVQRELIAAGSRMVDENKLFATIGDTLQTFGMDGVGRYFNDPASMPPPQPKEPQPDPIMISAQTQAMQAQAQAQLQAAKMQADERERERRHEIELQKLRLREIEVANNIQNERETLDLKEREAVMRDDLARDQEAIRAASAVPYGQVTGDTR